jgi:hypothetical protein
MKHNKSGFALIAVVISIPALLFFCIKIMHSMSSVLDIAQERKIFYQEWCQADKTLQETFLWLKNNYTSIKKTLKSNNNWMYLNIQKDLLENTSQILNNYFSLAFKINENDREESLVIEITKMVKNGENYPLIRCIFKTNEQQNTYNISCYTICSAL